MAVATIQATLPYDIQKVWDTVTSLENTSWRRDLSSVQVLSPTKFVEYTKEGYSTTFMITQTQPCQCWEFDMENDNIEGHWTGIFSHKNGETTITFTETVAAKKMLMKPFVKMYLKKQQLAYLSDLKRALANE
ncbi:MAG: SRPBCC family protein [Anaerotignum sp.]|nr:SRPBCC family protein [Anaerotignum sp.]